MELKLFSLFLLPILVGLALAKVLPEEPKKSSIEDASKLLLQVGNANDEFESHLLQSLEHEAAGKNVFVSAFSVSTVLSMLMSGAVNKTYSEIYTSLGFANLHFSNSDILSGYKQLMFQLNHPTKDSKNILSVANSIAIQKKRALLDSFLNNVINNFDAKIMVEDFVHESQKATDEINKWVSKKTEGKIPKLFSKKLDQSTVMVLLNAIYFKGAWENTFDKRFTKNADFHVTREHAEQVPLMTRHAHYNYAQFDDGKMLEIAYKNRSMSMYVFLPNDSHNRGISKMLTTDKLNHRISQLHSRDVVLHLPKFKFEGSYTLSNTLKKLGMLAAFLPGVADFSNIDGVRDLYVSEVVHKTFIDVNEEGSEAAAATGVIVKGWNSVHPPPVPIDFRVNRPFAFFIRDNQHQLTLFSGVINKPEYH